ncbi:glycosyltransferase family 2 protein [Gemmatimonadota bacterium]
MRGREHPLQRRVSPPPHAIGYVLGRDLRREVVVASVEDEQSGDMYCSATRLWPLYWFATTLVEFVREIGGWDEKFLQGMACEDNDFMARLFVQVGEIVISDAITCLHQSHAPAAYADGNRGWNVNRTYLLDKWGTAFEPFDNGVDPIRYEVTRPTPDTARMVYTGDRGPS